MTPPRLEPKTIAPWLAAAYAIHLVDEWGVGDGVAEWATRVAGMPFSNSEWLVVNAISLAVVAGVAWAIRSERLGAIALLILAGHVLMHATQHLAGSLLFGELSPGVATGLAFCLPASVVAIRLGFRLLPRSRAVMGLLIGLVSFQPIWHKLLLFVFSSSSHAA